MPRRDRRVRPRERALFKLAPPLQRLVRAAVYAGREMTVLPFMRPRFSKVPELMARAHLKRQIADPALRAQLTPGYAIGCKRILLSNEWYPALAQPNVEVVSDGIAEVREHAVVTTDGREHPVDTIILGTGFRITDMPYAEQIRGRGGRTLAEAWNGSMQALRGTTVHGFPNLLMLVGPNTGLGHNSIVFMIESQLRYVLGCLDAVERTGSATFEPRAEAQAAFNDAVQEHMRGTVWTSGGCASWYLDEQGRNTTLWPGTSWRFRQQTRRFEPAEYVLTAPVRPAPALTGPVPAAAC
jgi:cation diffusion facilitator CzcD-associated flavoprotein CzcO